MVLIIESSLPLLYICVQAIQILEFILKPVNGHVPSIAQLVELDVFKNMELRELRTPSLTVPTHICVHSMWSTAWQLHFNPFQINASFLHRWDLQSIKSNGTCPPLNTMTFWRPVKGRKKHTFLAVLPTTSTGFLSQLYIWTGKNMGPPQPWMSLAILIPLTMHLMYICSVVSATSKSKGPKGTAQ